MDLEGEGQGLTGLDGGDKWFCAMEDAGEEGLDFEAEGFA